MKRIREIGTETVISIVLLISIFFLFDPFRLLVGDVLRMCFTILTVIFTGLLAGAVWREKTNDERESAHRMLASRAGFIAGIIMLSIAIVVQMLQHALDGWLVASLGIMVIAKLVTLVISRQRW